MAFTARKCVSLNRPTRWHYLVQRVGSARFIARSQAPTEEAVITNKKELRSLNQHLWLPARN